MAGAGTKKIPDDGSTAHQRTSVLKVRRLPQRTLERLKRAFDQAQSTEGIKRPLVEYPCEECGLMVSVARKPRSDWPLRCGGCRRKARLKTKRECWHRYKEQYRLKRTRPVHEAPPLPTSYEDLPITPGQVRRAPMRVPPRQIATDSGPKSTPSFSEPAVVWTPESGHERQ